MSAGVGIWKDVLVEVVRARVPRSRTAVVPANTVSVDDDPLLCLVRQLFFSPENHGHRRVFFAAAAAETKIHQICEQIGQVLSDISQQRVAVMHASANSEAALMGQKSLDTARGSELSASPGVQIGERLWRIPVSLLDQVGRVRASDKPFQYVLFAGSVNHAIAPLFCRACDGAVLVLTANRTRKETAIRAADVLRQYHTRVLGAVLDERTFPIPEAIYKRL